jgi:hypothetical protein
MKKVKKKKNLRFARRTRAFCQVWLKKKNHTKRICESKQKSWKKKSFCFALHARAFC